MQRFQKKRDTEGFININITTIINDELYRDYDHATCYEGYSGLYPGNYVTKLPERENIMNYLA